MIPKDELLRLMGEAEPGTFLTVTGDEGVHAMSCRKMDNQLWIYLDGETIGVDEKTWANITYKYHPIFSFS